MNQGMQVASKFKITKPLLKKITTWAGNGLTRTDIAHLLGYSKDHWLVMMRSSDELEDAYMVGKSDMKSLLQKRVMVKALSDDKDALGAGTFLLNRHFPISANTEVVADTTGSTDDDIRDEILDELNS